MKEFNDTEYNQMISDLIHDMSYSNASNRGKVATIRGYTEVMVRKILDIGSDTKFTLGELKNKPMSLKMCELLGLELSRKLLDCVEEIRSIGNDATHTQRTQKISDKQVKNLEDDLMELHAVLFIKFFNSVTVELVFSPQTLGLFSLLPPIIRYKTWKYLFELDKNNIIIADKLSLAIIKTYGRENAMQWLEDNRNTLLQIPYPTKEDQYKYLVAHKSPINPTEFEFTLRFWDFSNIYELLKSKINNKKTAINESGKLYANYEEALKFFKQRINDYEQVKNYKRDDALEQMIDLIKFAYIGRKDNI